jgi:NAD(P)H-dependent flavin oxidoreductase YrpB (nitropropane dioxygenase family)
MQQLIFRSKYPILEACMNRGSTLELALAVYAAGGYPSLCSWTYNRHFSAMQRDLDKFVEQTNSNRIHLSFELDELPDPKVCHDIMKSHNVPTMEIIYGYTDSPRPQNEFLPNTELALQQLLKPLHDMGVKIFKRIYSPVDEYTMHKHFLDGFCIKGNEAAGFTGFIPTKELFLQQKQLTPNAILIPYGGVGTAAQVKEYIDLGAEIVAVGTLLAMSAESPIKTETKLAAIQADKEKIKTKNHTFQLGSTVVERKQNMLEFQPYIGQDDANGTAGLVRGLYKKNNKDGHAYLGHSINHVTSILSCTQIIQNLVKCL